MYRRFLSACIALVAALSFASSAFAQSQVPIYTSKAYITPNTREQHFQDMLNLQPGQEMLPLTLVVYNGPNNRTPFNWFRLNIAGYLLASEQDLHGKRTAVVDVTGRMQAGQSQVIIDCAGEPGATLEWALFTTPMQLRSVEPNPVQPGGVVVLQGTNFSATEELDKVLVNGQPVQVLSASATAITARMPGTIPAGNTSVQVVVGEAKSQKLPIAIASKPLPVLHSMNYWMAPPGAVLTITGANFSADKTQDRVFFRNVPGQVVFASPTRLQVIIPNWGYGPQEMNIPVWVIANGTRSGNYLPFDIGPKYLGALPPMPGDSTSQSTSESSSEASPFPLDASSEAITESSSQAGTENGSESMNEQGSEAGSEAPGPMIFP